MARASLANIRLRLRPMIADIGAIQIWSDDELDDILDQHRLDFYREVLAPQPRGFTTVVYRVYHSAHANLEEFDATDDTIFRLYDGSDVEPVITTDYTVDYIRGAITFLTNQTVNYYLDGRSFDLNGAAMMCWQEARGEKAKLYTFSEDGQKFDKSDWFKHIGEMIKMYDAKRRRRQAEAIRA